MSKLDATQYDREVQEYFLRQTQLSLFEITWYAHLQCQLPTHYFRSWTRRMKQLGGEDSLRRTLYPFGQDLA